MIDTVCGTVAGKALLNGKSTGNYRSSDSTASREEYTRDQPLAQLLLIYAKVERAQHGGVA